ncbi:MAG TPA: SDR family NAD(P)-dependent oxidoreductase, partial [Anaerolineae bacterium]|nr:SDR family NAD(P)-dependent oxidoreductase [Anaerolineae bacterium]
GGASGITAQLAQMLAQRYQPTLILLGRSAQPPDVESAVTAGLDQPKAIKAALIANQQRAGLPIVLADIERAYRQLLKERTIRHTLETLQAYGTDVRYMAADVRNPVVMQTVFAQIYAEFGMINGIVHGAGMIDDKPLLAKSAASFDRVFDTKVDGAYLLAKLVDPSTLKWMAFFSSASGVFGNTGQADYAAANSLLNQFAAQLDQQWAARVVAFCWGPWGETGMVSAELAQHFAQRGIPLIDPQIGCQTVIDELIYGCKGEHTVIYAEGEWGAMQ